MPTEIKEKNKIIIKMEEKNYKNYSREELITRIEELEYTLSKKNKSENVKNKLTTNRKRNIDFSKYNKRHIALKITYLGWNYDGYVVQDNTINTIEDHLFRALLKGCLIENREESNYHRCGRTDQGVSSFSQVISITVRSRLTTESSNQDELPYSKILNGLLPSDIRVIAWSPVPVDFSARFNCKQRTYKYWFPRGNMNIELMHKASQKLIGIHDFRNFCKMDVANGITNYTREIFNADITVFSKDSYFDNSDFDVYHLIITAKGFIWHQIRCIVSLLFLIGQKKEKPDIIDQLLNIKEYPRKPQYALASPLPLNLYSCEFDEVNWIINKESMTKVIKCLQTFWTSEKMKCCMLENILSDCYKLSDSSYSEDVGISLFRDINSKIYKPLLARPTGQTLDDRISFYVEKKKLKMSVEPKNDEDSIKVE